MGGAQNVFRLPFFFYWEFFNELWWLLLYAFWLSNEPILKKIEQLGGSGQMFFHRAPLEKTLFCRNYLFDQTLKQNMLTNVCGCVYATTLKIRTVQGRSYIKSTYFAQYERDTANELSQRRKEVCRMPQVQWKIKRAKIRHYNTNHRQNKAKPTRVCVHVRVCVCARACARVRVRACVRVFARFISKSFRNSKSSKPNVIETFIKERLGNKHIKVKFA